MKDTLPICSHSTAEEYAAMSEATDGRYTIRDALRGGSVVKFVA